MEHMDEEVQNEDEEEAPASNPGVGIGWSPNTNFDGVDTQQLFDDHFRTQSTRMLELNSVGIHNHYVDLTPH